MGNRELATQLRQAVECVKLVYTVNCPSPDRNTDITLGCDARFWYCVVTTLRMKYNK